MQLASSGRVSGRRLRVQLPFFFSTPRAERTIQLTPRGGDPPRTRSASVSQAIDVERRRGGGRPGAAGAGAGDDGDQAAAGEVQHDRRQRQRGVRASVAVLLRQRGGARAAPLVVAGAASGGRQRGHVRRRHVREQLPARRRGLRRQRIPPPLLLPAAQGEPAPRPLRRHAAEAWSPRLVQGCAREPGVAAGVVHLAARRPHPPSRQHDQPHPHRRPPRAAIWILEGRAGVPHLGLRRERALGALHQERRLCRRLRRALRPPRSDAVGAHHQLDHLYQQICSHVEPDHHRWHQPGAWHTPPRRQLRAHRRVRHRLPHRVRAVDPAPVWVAGTTLRCQVEVQVQGISDHPPASCTGLAGCRVCCWIGHGVQGRERERSLQLVPLPHLRADVKLEV